MSDLDETAVQLLHDDSNGETSTIHQCAPLQENSNHGAEDDDFSPAALDDDKNNGDDEGKKRAAKSHSVTEESSSSSKRARGGEAPPQPNHPYSYPHNGYFMPPPGGFYPMMYPPPSVQQQQPAPNDAKAVEENGGAAANTQQQPQPPFFGMYFPPPPHMMMAMMLQQQQQQQQQPPQRSGIGLALQCDAEHLSDYQILVRQQLELFAAAAADVESNTQGRKRPVTAGQVGLRCRHCAGLPRTARGSVYFPHTLHGVYQAAQNMAGSHLLGACPRVPDTIKEELGTLRQRRDNASGGKQYWADGCRALGVYEDGDGLRFESSRPAAPVPPPATNDAVTTV